MEELVLILVWDSDDYMTITVSPNEVVDTDPVIGRIKARIEGLGIADGQYEILEAANEICRESIEDYCSCGKKGKLYSGKVLLESLKS